jgi:hypothetical protein
MVYPCHTRMVHPTCHDRRPNEPKERACGSLQPSNTDLLMYLGVAHFTDEHAAARNEPSSNMARAATLQHPPSETAWPMLPLGLATNHYWRLATTSPKPTSSSAASSATGPHRAPRASTGQQHSPGNTTQPNMQGYRQSTAYSLFFVRTNVFCASASRRPTSSAAPSSGDRWLRAASEARCAPATSTTTSYRHAR